MTNEEISDQTFDAIRRSTAGMLKSDVYKAIYEAAVNVKEGIYVDIGPAQGGSTISIALGRRAAGRQDLIYTADVFTGSNALKTSDVNTNVSVLKDNLAAFGVGDGINIIIVGQQDIETSIPKDASIGLLFIDADGALDRDFEQFYDRIIPGGFVILDDCEDKAIEKYVQYPPDRLEKYVKSKGAKKIRDLTPFGKHYTVYKFTKNLVSLGLMKEIKTVNNTVFLRKTGDKAYAESGAPQALAETRDAIARDFFEAREDYFDTAG
ncbi:class I SAM-dependent methyltransferase [Mesorhizobium sophorae]|uniref:class I SAM-dependent methyltransferase n=1 Tax=Mesorhizobium sophorae TaxID=1300294 RepID=UPI000BA38C94|nr:class I SAM-dependent methyltransferase [Mesorhizobium sophorae]